MCRKIRSLPPLGIRKELPDPVTPPRLPPSPGQPLDEALRMHSPGLTLCALTSGHSPWLQLSTLAITWKAHKRPELLDVWASNGTFSETLRKDRRLWIFVPLKKEDSYHAYEIPGSQPIQLPLLCSPLSFLLLFLRLSYRSFFWVVILWEVFINMFKNVTVCRLRILTKTCIPLLSVPKLTFNLRYFVILYFSL